MRQLAYARRAWGAKGPDKKTIALDVGYSPSVSRSVVSKIESRPGFNNAIAKLAAESNNMALTVLSEFKARGLTDFSNKDLISSLSAIASAWDKFNKGLVQAEKPQIDNGKNRLKTVILQNIAKQVNVQSSNESPAIESPAEEATPVEFEEVPNPDLDF